MGSSGFSAVLIGGLQILVALLMMRARLHVVPAAESWPRVRERDGVRPSVLLLICLTLLLGVMRATGLDVWLIVEGRIVAHEGDWYQSRSELQYVLLGVLVLLYAGAMLALRHVRLRGPAARIGLGMAALVALIHLQLLRIVSLHAVDSVMYVRLPFVTLGTALELAAAIIAIVSFAPIAFRPTSYAEATRADQQIASERQSRRRRT